MQHVVHQNMQNFVLYEFYWVIRNRIQIFGLSQFKDEEIVKAIQPYQASKYEKVKLASQKFSDFCRNCVLTTFEDQTMKKSLEKNSNSSFFFFAFC